MEENLRAIDEAMSVYLGPRVSQTQAVLNLLDDLVGWCEEHDVKIGIHADEPDGYTVKRAR